MRLRSASASNAFLCVFTIELTRAHGTCLVVANVVLPAKGANSVSPNPLAGFEGLLRGGGKRLEGKEGKGQKGREKHHRNKFLVRP